MKPAKPKLLDSYLMRELTPPFVLGALLFAALLILQTAFASSELLSGAAPFGLFLEYVLYQIPQTAAYVLPVAVAFAVALTATRLAREAEYLALNAARISPARIFLPVLFFAVLAGLASFAGEQFIAPKAAQKAHQVFTRLVASGTHRWPSEHLFFKGPEGALYYVRHLDKARHELFEITVVKRVPEGLQVISAPKATYSGEHWQLLDGALYLVKRDGSVAEARRFKQLPLELKAAVQEYWADTRPPSELSVVELAETVKILQQSGIMSRRTREMALDMQFKLVLPFMCVVVACLAFPFAIRFARGGYAAGLLVAMLTVFFANGALNWSRTLAELGVFSPVLAAWWAPLCLLAIGVVSFARCGVGR